MSVVGVSFLSIWKDTLFKIQHFPAAATIDPPGGLTSPPQPPPPPVLLGRYVRCGLGRGGGDSGGGGSGVDRFLFAPASEHYESWSTTVC